MFNENKIKTKKYYIGFFCLILATCLFFLIKNLDYKKDIPIVSKIEQLSQDQINQTWLKASATYITLKAIQITPKMFENVEVPAVKIRLGAILSPIVEQLDMIDSVLFYALLVTLGEKFLLGWITPITLGLIIPLGLVLYGISRIMGFGLIRDIGSFLMQIGLLFYLLLPTTALINQSVYNTFDVDKKINSIQQQGDSFKQDYEQKIEQVNEEKGWLEKITDGIKDFVNSIVDFFNPSKMVDRLNDILDDFMEMIAVFVITTIVVPIGVFIVFLNMLKRIYSPQMSNLGNEAIQEIQKPTKKIEELLEKIVEQNTKQQKEK